MGQTLVEFLRQLREQATQVWAALSLAQRVTLVMFVGATAVLVALLAFWSSRPDYVPVAGGLTPEQVTSASAKLRDSQIPFRYEAGRGTLTVPSGRLDDARLLLADIGLSGGAARTGGVDGFEVFDKSLFGMTDFVQKINHIRALQRSLEQKIRLLDGVESAQVTLSIPEEELFTRNRQDPKASVEVKPLRGRDLSAGQVASIRHIVAAAVPKLTPQNVAVMDSQGRLLARFQSGMDDLALVSENLETRVKTERYLTDKVESLLDHVLGPGRAAVQVAVQLDFSRVERSTKKMDPDSGVPLTENSQTSESRGTSGAGGITGVRANMPGEANATTSGSGDVQFRKEKNGTMQYHYDTIQETVRPEVGAIKRLSVAVMVKPRVVGTGADQKIETLSPQDLRALTEAVEGAVGYSEERADVVRVVNAPAPATPNEAFIPPPPPPTAPPIADVVERYLPGAATLLGVLALAWVFFRSMKRLSTPTPVFQATVGDEAGTRTTAAPAMGAVQFQDMQHEAQELVSKNTSQATAIIRGMLRS